MVFRMRRNVSGDIPLRPGTTWRWLYFALGFSLSYTALRYVFFAGVPPSDWPLFLLNKVLSLAGLVLLALSYLIGKVPWPGNPDVQQRLSLVKFCGVTGFALIVTHAFASLLLVSPAYYPAFFAGAKLSIIGSLSLLLGILSLWCFVLPAIATIPFMYESLGAELWLRRQRMGYLGLALSALHVGVMGFEGWGKPGTWPGHLPPISLLSCIFALVPLVYRFGRSRKPSDRV